MSKTPLVSIVIPCRNAVGWLAEAIESCLAQSWRNLQVIVVDNGSTDGSLALANSYRSRGVFVLECQRQGASAARNVGLARADGDFIQFLDADDMLGADKIRLQVERLATAPAAAIASGAWARFRRSPSEAIFTAELVWQDLAPSDFLVKSWLGGGMMPSFVWLTPRPLIARAGTWNESLSLNDDGEFFSRIVLASSGVMFCSNARGFYRTGQVASLSGRSDREAFVSGLLSLDLSCEWLLRRDKSAAALRACATQYRRFAYATYPHAPDLVNRAERRCQELGSCQLRPGGGRTFQMLTRMFGWKFAKRCQLASRKLGESIAWG